MAHGYYITVSKIENHLGSLAVFCISVGFLKRPDMVSQNFLKLTFRSSGSIHWFQSKRMGFNAAAGYGIREPEMVHFGRAQLG